LDFGGEFGCWGLMGVGRDRCRMKEGVGERENVQVIYFRRNCKKSSVKKRTPEVDHVDFVNTSYYS
jgi:hypothetical protein